MFSSRDVSAAVNKAADRHSLLISTTKVTRLALGHPLGLATPLERHSSH
jgi:hypothetical protein